MLQTISLLYFWGEEVKSTMGIRNFNLRRGQVMMAEEDSSVSKLNTLRTGDANLRFLRFCITTVKDE
jgi:hypothetical protein